MSRKRSHSSSSSDSTTSSSSSSSDGNDRKRKRDRSNSKTRQQESARKYDSSGPNDRGSLHRRETKDLQCLSSENKPLRRSESSSSSSSESDDARQKRKERKKLKKEKKRRKKELKKEKKRLKKEEKKSKKLAKKAKKLLQKSQDLKIPPTVSEPVPGPAPGPPIPELSDRAKAMKPMTKEEWDKRQQVVRKVYDEETGRHRLIKGDGEVLEEIVSRDRHKEINRQATRGDGAFFQSHLAGKIPR